MNMTNTWWENFIPHEAARYEILESGIFIFMKPESNNVFILYFGYENLNRDMRYTWLPKRGYEICLIVQEGIWDTLDCLRGDMRCTSLPERGYEIHIITQEGIWLFFCISKKEYEFMPGSKQPISKWDSIKVQDKRYYHHKCSRTCIQGWHHFTTSQQISVVPII